MLGNKMKNTFKCQSLFGDKIKVYPPQSRQNGSLIVLETCGEYKTTMILSKKQTIRLIAVLEENLRKD